MLPLRSLLAVPTSLTTVLSKCLLAFGIEGAWITENMGETGMPIRIERPVTVGNKGHGINVGGNPDLVVTDPMSAYNGGEGINVETHPAEAPPVDTAATEVKPEGWWKRFETVWLAPAIIVMLGAIATYFLS